MAHTEGLSHGIQNGVVPPFDGVYISRISVSGFGHNELMRSLLVYLATPSFSRMLTTRDLLP